MTDEKRSGDGRDAITTIQTDHHLPLFLCWNKQYQGWRGKRGKGLPVSWQVFAGIMANHCRKLPLRPVVRCPRRPPAQHSLLVRLCQFVRKWIGVFQGNGLESPTFASGKGKAAPSADWGRVTIDVGDGQVVQRFPYPILEWTLFHSTLRDCHTVFVPAEKRLLGDLTGTASSGIIHSTIVE